MTKLAALQGVRVLDFSKILAGPLCAQYLGDMGADVVKVEPIDVGDDTRRYPPFRTSEKKDQRAKVGDGASPDVDGTIFLSANRNKRSFALDLKSQAGREICHKLVETADVVIESFGPGVAERLGIDHATLMAINPRLIHCSISGYGSVGPMREGKGYDAILQAFSGMLSITGERSGKPVRSPFSPVDQGAGMQALTGILAGLLDRTHTGLGMRVETSLYDASIGFLGYILQGFWETGHEPQPPGSSHDSLVPYEVFETGDKPLMLGVANDVMWQKFCTVAGADALGNDLRFRTNAQRVANRAEAVAAVSALLMRRTRAQWIHALSDVGIPVSPVNTLAEMEDHPHTAASGIVQTYQHPVYGELRTVSQPLKFGGKRNQVTRAAPLLGEHTREIMLEAGYTAEEFDAFLAAHVIGARTGKVA